MACPRTYQDMSTTLMQPAARPLALSLLPVLVLLLVVLLLLLVLLKTPVQSLAVQRTLLICVCVKHMRRPCGQVAGQPGELPGLWCGGGVGGVLGPGLGWAAKAKKGREGESE